MKKALLFLAVIVLVAAPSFGDSVIILKSGGKIQGTLTSNDETSVNVKVSFGEIMILKSKIEKIETVTPDALSEEEQKNADSYVKGKAAEWLVDFEGHWVKPELKEFREQERVKQQEALKAEGDKVIAQIKKITTPYRRNNRTNKRIEELRKKWKEAREKNKKKGDEKKN